MKSRSKIVPSQPAAPPSSPQPPDAAAPAAPVAASTPPEPPQAAPAVDSEGELLPGRAQVTLLAECQGVRVEVNDAEHDKQMAAAVLANVLRGASICAQVPVERIPVAVRPGAGGGLIFQVRLKLNAKDRQVRDSVATVIIAVVGSALEAYGYGVQLGTEQVVAAS